MVTYSKKSIETGNVPIDKLLLNSVYYPACGFDGRPVKRLNPLFAQYGINSYVYVDYIVGKELLAEKQDDFKNYHVLAVRELKESDLVPGGWNPDKYLAYLSPKEIEEMKKSFQYERIDPGKAFGRWVVYERNNEADETVGPEQFSLLYIGGEGAATYAALYLTRNIAPSVLVDINPGIAFGGNYPCFRSVLSKIIESGQKLPKYYLSGGQGTSAADCTLQDYKKGRCLE